MGHVVNVLVNSGVCDGLLGAPGCADEGGEEEDIHMSHAHQLSGQVWGWERGESQNGVYWLPMSVENVSRARSVPSSSTNRAIFALLCALDSFSFFV